MSKVSGWKLVICNIPKKGCGGLPVASISELRQSDWPLVQFRTTGPHSIAWQLVIRIEIRDTTAAPKLRIHPWVRAGATAETLASNATDANVINLKM